ncbi:MAG: ABC transporter permease [Planctomycetota bacterium]
MLWNILILALREMQRNVLRSGLTMLGIVIGVWAVITMVTLGDGATERVKGDIGKLGYNLIILLPGVERKSGGAGPMPGAEPFEMSDLDAIREQIPLAEAVAPLAVHPILAVTGNRNWTTVAQGSDNNFFTTRGWTLQSGRKFSASEMRGGSPVCILGETVRQELFADTNPVGEKVRLGKLSYEVIGIMESKGQSISGEDQDDLVLLPIATLQRRITGNRNVSMIFISAATETAAPRVKEGLTSLMRERRSIPDEADADFAVRDLKEISALMEETSGVLTAFVGAIAGVSLLVGGIGIMNTMLVTVTERTREIGTRLAIGALEREVMQQFLLEAAVLSAFGGLLGIILGLLSSAVLANYLEIPYVLNYTVVLAAFGFSALVGLLFGSYPAMKAARLNPIDALRHE